MKTRWSARKRYVDRVRRRLLRRRAGLESLALAAIALALGATTAGAQARPAPMSLFVIGKTPTSITFDWTQGYEHSYNGYYMRVDDGARVKYPQSEGTVRGLAAGSSYQFCVSIDWTSHVLDESDPACITASTGGAATPSPPPSPELEPVPLPNSESTSSPNPAPQSGFGTTCGPGNWPGAGRTPFSLGALRPFARPIPADPPLLTNSAGYTSAQMVAWMNARGSVDEYTINTGGSWDYAHPYYCASSSDPLVTLRDTTYIGANDGTEAHIPAIAHRRSAAAAGGDGHVTIIQPDGSVIGAWQYAGVSNGVARASGWAKESHVDTGDGQDNFTSTAAWFNNLAGSIRLQELEAGQINHALFLYTNCTWGSAVYPAKAGTTAKRCNGPRAAPPLGAHLQLDPDYVLPSGLPPWKYPILRALQTYGGYIGDTGAYTRPISFGLMLESGQHYVQHGEGDRLGQWANAHKAQGDISAGVNGTPYYLLDFARGVDWSRLRVVSPCVADASC